MAASWVLLVSRVNPDYYEYSYLAKRLVTEGKYGFKDEWKQIPRFAHSQWRYLYDETGMARPPGFPVELANSCPGAQDVADQVQERWGAARDGPIPGLAVLRGWARQRLTK